MIKANELRKGNLILIDKKHYAKVTSIGEKSFTTFNPHNKYIDGSSGDCWKYETDYTEPIPLTPQVLEKCRFEKEGDYYLLKPVTNNQWYLKESSFPGEPPFYGMCIKWLDKEVNISMITANHPTAIHQLQNLYFALTGQELTISDIAIEK